MLQREVRQGDSYWLVELDPAAFAQLHECGRGKQLGHRTIQVDGLGGGGRSSLQVTPTVPTCKRHLTTLNNCHGQTRRNAVLHEGSHALIEVLKRYLFYALYF